MAGAPNSSPPLRGGGWGKGCEPPRFLDARTPPPALRREGEQNSVTPSLRPLLGQQVDEHVVEPGRYFLPVQGGRRQRVDRDTQCVVVLAGNAQCVAEHRCGLHARRAAQPSHDRLDMPGPVASGTPSDGRRAPPRPQVHLHHQLAVRRDTPRVCSARLRPCSAVETTCTVMPVGRHFVRSGPKNSPGGRLGIHAPRSARPAAAGEAGAAQQANSERQPLLPSAG